MSGNGQHTTDGVLHWSSRVLTVRDLQGQLNGQREVIVGARAVVSPLAVEHLRAAGIALVRDAEERKPTTDGLWGVAQDRPYPVVASVINGLARDGIPVKELKTAPAENASGWARELGACIVRGECLGGVCFCEDPGLVCCVANKVAGIRAVAVASAAHATRASRTLGVNLAAVEMSGRTFFEIRQILKTLCSSSSHVCPDGVACTLQELDGHAHR